MQFTLKQSLLVAGVSVLIGIGFLLTLLVLPAPGFSPTTITIQPGTTVSSAAERLAEKDIVLHPLLVSLPLRLQDKEVTAGAYKFSDNQHPLGIAQRLHAGDFQTKQQEVVIPEGFTRAEIADRVVAELDVDFSRSDFMQTSEGLEGYLFPDTYQFSPDASARQVVNTMRENFRTQIAKLQPQLREFPYSKKQVIAMASLIEREAADYRIRRKIAGILWTRFEQGMPLQVDAVFAFLLGKASAELTQADLAMDSPYNLYQNTGLPPTPIANPGLGSIRATINPIRTDDLYYLTGDNGQFYFAETLEEHNRNKRNYIR